MRTAFGLPRRRDNNGAKTSTLLAEKVRDAVNEHLLRGYEETVDWGMLAWVVPLATLPNTHHGHPDARIHSQATATLHCAPILEGMCSESAPPNLGVRLCMPVQ